MATERNVVDFKIHNLTEEQFQELKAQGKIDPNALYCTPDETLKTNQITNCITEIPQDIKLELADGVLTLKAGSKVYVPNGAGVFDTRNITVDRTYTQTTDGQYFLSARQDTSIWGYLTSTATSGTTPPTGTGTFYNTTTNSIDFYNNGTYNERHYSFPFALITVSNGAISSIDQVFNGFGYIGSTVFALPDVKGLIPNGRNADGTLKNISVKTTNVKTISENITENLLLMLYSNGDIAYSLSDYWEWDERLNKLVHGKDTLEGCVTGKVRLENGKITSFEPKTAFHAVDYSDFEALSDTVETNNDNAVHKTGNETIGGTKHFTGDIKYGSLSKDGSFKDMEIRDANGIRLGALRGQWTEDGNRRIEMFTATTDGTRGAGIATYTTADGIERCTAKTPTSTSNTNEIATTAFVKSVLSGNDVGLAKFSKGEAGYYKFTNGLIIQWGSAEEGQTASVTLPTAFTSTNYSVVGTYAIDNGTDSYTQAMKVRTQTTTGFTAACKAQARWIAIGY